MSRRLLLFVVVVATLPASSAVAVVWPVASGGNDHIYELVETQQTFDSARSNAATLPPPAPGYGQGHLATITSAAEQAFIAGSFPPPSTCSPFQGPCIWIGGSDADTEGTWRWVTGPEEGDQFHPGGYSAWAAGEPNDYSTGEDCVIYAWNGTTQWNDVPCDGLAKALVEWEPDPGATTTTSPPPTVTTTTDTTMTTTTTEPPGECGDPAKPAGLITAADALRILKAAVALNPCPACTCDVDRNGKISSTDALRTLRRAVGLPVQIDCPACD